MLRLRFLTVALALAPLSFTVLSGCSDSESPDADWLGDWTASGNATNECGGVTAEIDASGSLVIASVTGSEFTTTLNDCVLHWTVSASDSTKATLDAGQSCEERADGGSAKASYTSGSGTLATTTMTLKLTGTAPGGCKVSEDLSLTRTTKPEMMK